MRRIEIGLIGIVILALAVGARLAAGGDQTRAQAPPRSESGWNIPPGAETEKNPLQVTDTVLTAGRALFRSKCQRCHGPQGTGDGPDADPDYMAEMNLTNPQRASHNPDGVVFYRVWNGRERPKMPAFKTEMTKEQVWTVVSFVQTLRKGGEQRAASPVL